jgi:GxxExxY protein
MEIVYRDESYQLMGACFEVYRQQGSGFLEPVYQESLQIELEIREIPFEAQERLSISYKGRPLKSKFRPDFIAYDKIILEIKAASSLTDVDRAQLHNYLRITGYRLGLLVNFGTHPKLQSERIVN